MSDRQTMRISADDLFDPKVEGFLEEQAMLNRAAPDIPEQSFLAQIFFSSWFYLGVAGCIGALIGWGILEPYLNDGPDDRHPAAGLLFFAVVTGFIGLCVGASEGIITRNLSRAAISALVGLGVGFVGGLVLTIPANIIYGIVVGIALSDLKEGERPHGMGLFALIVVRAIAWSLVAIPAGLGQGIALRERKIIWNGILGAVLGGLIGGMLFDPIDIWTSRPDDASISRAIGCGVIGVMVGVFIGLVEQWTKTAWLLMRAGPLAGKQFVMYRQTTVVGSSPKADIYLFKDEAIDPRHALIHNRGGRFEIEDCGSEDGTYINGIPVKKQMLKAGDQIVMGKTVLEFALRESSQ